MILSILAVLIAVLAGTASLFYFLKGKEFVAKYLIIGPFLHVVGVLDFLIGLVIPYKYDDVDLPRPKSTLSKITDASDPSAPYRSTLAADLVRLENKETNIYEEFKTAAKKYWYNQTMGVREVLSIDDEMQPNGKVFKKLSLGSYKWTTYENGRLGQLML